MKLTLESTSKIVQVEGPDGGLVPARLWEGTTADGIPVIALVTRVAVKLEHDLEAFHRDLVEQRPPSAEARAWPNRLVL